MRTKQAGFTAISVMVALVVVSMLVTSQIDAMAVRVVDEQRRKTAAEGVQIVAAVQNYYADANPGRDRWPPTRFGSRLDSVIYKKYLASKGSVYGNDWELSSGHELSLDTGDANAARIIAAGITGARATGAIVSVTIGRPGDEASHSMLYHLEGHRALQGNLDANQKAISNADTVQYD